MRRPAVTRAPVRTEPWWTGGRIAAAIVLVLVLTGGAGFAGFLAGLTVGGTDSLVGALDATILGGGLDIDVDGGSDFEGFDDDVPGFTPLTVEGEPGPAVARGDTIAGTLEGDAVDHELALDTAGPVTIEVTSDDFDTVLVLLDEAGALVDSDDDGAETGTDSLLELDLAASTYVVRVQSWGSGGDGAYTLSVG